MNPNSLRVGQILDETKIIAVVGLSNKPERASYMVGKYLVRNGYKVIPVHPNIKEWEGFVVYKNLAEIPDDVDMVDIFANPKIVGKITSDIIAKKPKVAWFQLGIVNNESAVAMRTAGIEVVQNMCTKIEHSARA